MVVGGLPVRISDHADQVATMALDLLHQSGRFQIGHLPTTPLRLRIGIHTGGAHLRLSCPKELTTPDTTLFLYTGNLVFNA